MKFLIILIIPFIFSCYTIPGGPGWVSESVSDFDGTRMIQMEPAWLYSSPMKLGLFHSSKMPDSSVILTAIVKGISNFSKGKSLHFNIDGEFISMESFDEITDIEIDPGIYDKYTHVSSTSWSSKDYLISKKFIKQLIEGKKVLVKIDLDKEFVEGEFSSDAPTTARPGFREFYEKISKAH